MWRSVKIFEFCFNSGPETLPTMSDPNTIADSMHTYMYMCACIGWWWGTIRNCKHTNTLDKQEYTYRKSKLFPGIFEWTFETRASNAVFNSSNFRYSKFCWMCRTKYEYVHNTLRCHTPNVPTNGPDVLFLLFLCISFSLLFGSSGFSFLFYLLL